jgi:uncharacterized protein with ParB-like and HNH nuclease domain
MSIQPKDQNVDTVFSNTNYYIDFYQREYKWKEAQVTTLLDDIFYKFDLHYKEEGAEPSEQVIENYEWYYLSTYITNRASGGRVFVVDGQQRLTTLTLILVKLYHLCSEHEGFDNLASWVQKHILDYAPQGKTFWMGHGKRKDPMQKLFEGEQHNYDKAEHLTAATMMENYAVISNYMDEAFPSERKLHMFVLYFLLRVVMVRLDVEQTDVPMVFEVINDRGVRLKPHEILKGKLLGKIPRKDIDTYNEIWEDRIGSLDAEENADDFFQTYFKSLFSNTRKGSHRFGDDYQRRVFDEPFNEELGFRNNELPQRAVANIKEFVKDDITYYTDLYNRVDDLGESLHESFSEVRYNRLNSMNTQTLLILAVCERNDSREDEKIRTIARELDRFYSLARLNVAYDSNQFNDAVYEMRQDLVHAEPEGYRSIFEDKLLSTINSQRSADLDKPFHYPFFRQASYQDFQQTFLRYFFARVEKFIADGIGKNIQARTMRDLVRNTGHVNGHHIEHILSRNEENLALFDHDEEHFEQQRNRLGALLLLNGRENQSSGNEPYEEKLKTYSGGLYWNHSLSEDFYHSKLNTKDFVEEEGLDLHPIDTFDQEAIEQRTEVLFEMTKRIWK